MVDISRVTPEQEFIVARHLTFRVSFLRFLLKTKTVPHDKQAKSSSKFNVSNPVHLGHFI